MKNTAIALVLLAALPLCACAKKENPLTKADIDQLVSVAWKAKTKEIEFCALQWANQSAAKSADLKKCEAVAVQLIPIFEKDGFKDLTAEDMEFPSLWIAFNKKAKDTNDLKENTKKFNSLFKL